jgi:hypothetical protein
MAQIKFGSGIAGMSGKAGGVVYSRGRSGAIARNWVKPVNPRSSRQVAQRSILTAASGSWSVLTDAQKQAWNDYAAGFTLLNRLGEPYTPSGRQMYVSINNNLINAGQAQIDVPTIYVDRPVIVNKGAFSGLGNTGVVTALHLTAYNITDLSGTDINYSIQMTPPLKSSLGPNSAARLLRQVFSGVPVFAGGPPAIKDLTSAYNATFGAPVASAGQQVWFTITFVDIVVGLTTVTELDFFTLT